MNFIHYIDVLFFIVMPIGVIIYAIKYALDDIKGYDLEFSEKDELTQSKTKGAYWCDGCYTWQLPKGHNEHIDNCDCNP